MKNPAFLPLLSRWLGCRCPGWKAVSWRKAKANLLSMSNRWYKGHLNHQARASVLLPPQQIQQLGEGAGIEITITKTAMAETSKAIMSIYEEMGPITDLIKSVSNSEEILEVLIQELYEKLSKLFGIVRIDEIAYEMRREQESWENTELHIAVTGEAGSGKSSFINAMRGLKAGDPGAADVGVTETTLNATCYKHPNDPNVMLWDLPGIGSVNFQPENYLKEVVCERYDFFVILGSKRFQKIHIDLAQEIEKKKKKFYFVRSKVDENLTNMKRDYPKDFKVKKVLDHIKQDCDRPLQKYLKCPNPQVFLISSCNLDRFDFTRLIEKMKEDLPRLKKLKFILSLPSVSPDIIQKKKELYEKELWKISLMSACINAIPIPGIPVAFDAECLHKYMVSMYKSFGLDPNSLGLLSRHINIPVEELRAHIRSSPEKRIQKSDIVKVCSDLTSKFWMIWKRQLLTFVGFSLVNLAFSFVITYMALLRFLNEIVEDAKRVSELAQENVRQEF